jgi:uncharacterized protein
MRWIYLLFMIGFVVPNSGCGGEETPRGTAMTEPQFRQDGTLDFVGGDGRVITTIAIEIADTPASREQGLMYRRSMPPQSGMLFVFDAPDMLSFWMRNTAMPLDIIFVSADRQIVSIAPRTRPLSEDHVRAEEPAQYVVEVRAGFSERHGITPGTTVRWARSGS